MSELLGSFGDNELSPECLDGAQRFLKGQPCFEFKIYFFPLIDADLYSSRVTCTQLCSVFLSFFSAG